MLFQRCQIRLKLKDGDGLARPGVARPGQARPGLAWPGQAKRGLAWPSQAWPGLARPVQGRPGQAWRGLASTRSGRQPGDETPTGQPGMPRCLVAWLLSNRLAKTVMVGSQLADWLQ